MKLWVVYSWAPYENEWGHVFFQNEENAHKFYSENGTYGILDIKEIQTQD